MTLYAPADVRKDWRINYGIPSIATAKSAYDFWERRGGVPSGCVLALAHAIEQIDDDEALLRQALEAIDELMYSSSTPIAALKASEAMIALKERLG